MKDDYLEIIDKYYPVGSLRRDIFMRHSRSVADLALQFNRDGNLGLDEKDVEAAAMLHDIGIFMTDAKGIGCEGEARYIQHGPLGADLLRREGYDEKFARVAERHTGTGLTADLIEQLGLPLPPVDYMPETLLERLVCYADKFYSKSGDMKRKSFRKARASIARHGGDALMRFDRMAEEFGHPQDQD